MTTTDPTPEPVDTIAEELVQRGANQLRDIHETRERLTEHFRTYAGTLVALRRRFITPDGHVDIAGRSQAYRDAVARIYEVAGIPPDSISSLQASIRYHVGNALREAFTAEELAEAGLQAESPRERARAVAEGVIDLREGADARAVVQGALEALQRLAGMVDDLTDATVRREVLEGVAHVQSVAVGLLARLALPVGVPEPVPERMGASPPATAEQLSQLA